MTPRFLVTIKNRIIAAAIVATTRRPAQSIKLVADADLPDSLRHEWERAGGKRHFACHLPTIAGRHMVLFVLADRPPREFLKTLRAKGFIVKTGRRPYYHATLTWEPDQ